MHKVIAANWKMHKITSEAVGLAKDLVDALQDIDELKVVICPAFTVLASVYEIIRDSKLFLGAQDMFWEAQGAYTGEISGIMLKDVGCEYVIIGHSERREIFQETDERINKKLKTALSIGLIPIFCLGETLEQRENGQTFSIVESQLIQGLADIPGEEIDKIIIAYEPIWAIGTGRNATGEQAEEVHHFIKGFIQDRYSLSKEDVCVIYGGSVKQDNIRELISQPNIDGALVGGASLDREEFARIIKQTGVA